MLNAAITSKQRTQVQHELRRWAFDSKQLNRLARLLTALSLRRSGNRVLLFQQQQAPLPAQNHLPTSNSRTAWPQKLSAHFDRKRINVPDLRCRDFHMMPLYQFQERYIFFESALCNLNQQEKQPLNKLQRLLRRRYQEHNRFNTTSYRCCLSLEQLYLLWRFLRLQQTGSTRFSK